jgi:glyoxylase-like metal-dependent hydrolase (beta-lactamase superfamily II)
MLVEMKNADLVLVDTPYTPEATQEVIEWSKDYFGDRDIVVINTGYHYDNLGGNSYLVEKGFRIYGSELTAKLTEERGDEMRALTLDWLRAPENKRYYGVHEKLSYVAPTHLYNIEEGLELRFKDEVVEVYYPGPTHAPDNVVVYFDRKKILFGGCMIIGWDSVGNTSDADLENWSISVRKLNRFDFDILVPGHGDRYDPALLEHTIDLIMQYHE